MVGLDAAVRWCLIPLGSARSRAGQIGTYSSGAGDPDASTNTPALPSHGLPADPIPANGTRVPPAHVNHHVLWCKV
jgi:hypothetical protein